MLSSLHPMLKNMEDLLSCLHCHKVMTDPHLALHCQHHFCGNCMENCLNLSECLACHKPLIPRDIHSPPFLQNTLALLSRLQAALDLPTTTTTSAAASSPLDSKQGTFGTTTTTSSSSRLEGLEEGGAGEDQEARGKSLPEWDESETLDPATRNPDNDEFGLSKRPSQPDDDESMQQRDLSLSPELVRRGTPLKGLLDLTSENPEERSFSLGSKRDSDISTWQGQQARLSGGAEEPPASESRPESALPIFTSSESSENHRTTTAAATTTTAPATTPRLSNRERDSSQSEPSPTIAEIWNVTTLRNRRQTKSSIVVYQRTPESAAVTAEIPATTHIPDLDSLFPDGKLLPSKPPEMQMEGDQEQEKPAPKSSEKRKREDVEQNRGKEQDSDHHAAVVSSPAQAKTRDRGSKKLRSEPKEEAGETEREIEPTETESTTEARKTPTRRSRQRGKDLETAERQKSSPERVTAPKPEKDVFDFTLSQFPEPANPLPKMSARKNFSLELKKAPSKNQPPLPSTPVDDSNVPAEAAKESAIPGEPGEPAFPVEPLEPAPSNHPKVRPAKAAKVTFAPGLENAPERETKKNLRRTRAVANQMESDAKLWSCPSCTFQNVEGWTKCKMCEKPKKRPLEPPSNQSNLSKTLPGLLGDHKSDDDFEPENPKPPKNMKKTRTPLPREPSGRNTRTRPPAPVPAEKSPTEKKPRSPKPEKTGKDEQEDVKEIEEAVRPEHVKAKRASKENRKPPVVIVHSGLSEKEKTEIGSVVNQIDPKASILEDQEDPRVTHVITSADDQGKCKRTMKYLCGIVRGLWVVSYEWLRASAQKGHWVDEAPFEIKGDSVFGLGDAPEKGRMRLERGEEPLFAGLSFFFQGAHSRPPRSDLELLIRGGGGKLLLAQPKGGKEANKNVVALFDPSTTNPKSAPLVALTKALTTKESSWVMNSISQYQCNF